MKATATLSILGTIVAICLQGAPAHAQATRTWVSGVGDDANPCSRTAPCKTFAGAISKTAAGGIINCLDPGGFGAVTITKALTIDCLGVGGAGGVLVTLGSNGIIINAGVNDIVVLRGLSIEGVGTGSIGVRYVAGRSVNIEKSRIYGFRGASALGIDFSVPTGVTAELFVSDTEITDNGTGSGNGGVQIRGTGTGSAKAVFNRVQLNNNSQGIFMSGTGTTGALRAVLKDTSISGNSNDGIFVSTPNGGPIVQAFLDSCVVSGNATGVTSNGANATAFLSDTTVTANDVGLNPIFGGQMTSYLNNHVNGNISNNGNFNSTITPQ